MTDWQQLADELKTHDTLKDLTEAQAEALILVLQVLVHADDRVSFTENMELEHMLMQLPWSPDKANSLDDLRAQAAERVKSDSATDALLKEAADALQAKEIREKVFLMAAILGNADGGMGEHERAFMKTLAQHFALTDARADALLAEGKDSI